MGTLQRRSEMGHERRWPTQWLRLGVVVILMLATIGTWELVKMLRVGNQAHADGVVADHLTCYDVKAGRNLSNETLDPRALVQLRDQFFPTGVEAEVRQLRLLCTAATKTRL